MYELNEQQGVPMFCVCMKLSLAIPWVKFVNGFK